MNYYRWYGQLVPLTLIAVSTVIFLIYFCLPPEPEYDIIVNS